MWHCTECRRVFEEPDFYLEDPSPPGISLPPGFYKFEMCPYCGSEYIEKYSDDEEDWDKDDVWNEDEE